MISLHEAMVDPNLFGGTFAAPSWSSWRTVAKVLDGLPLDATEAELFRKISGRTSVPAAVRAAIREAYFAIARRGGKSLFVAAIAVHAAALSDYAALLAAEFGGAEPPGA